MTLDLGGVLIRIQLFGLKLDPESESGPSGPNPVQIGLKTKISNVHILYNKC